MTKWEYFIAELPDLTKEELNHHGKFGWELISAEFKAHHNMGKTKYTYWYCILKRPVQ